MHEWVDGFTTSLGEGLTIAWRYPFNSDALKSRKEDVSWRTNIEDYRIP